MNTRILIVEDELLVASDLEARLKQMGHQVLGIATTGEEAITLAEQHRPDVVLMDIQLAGQMNGQQAASIIQNARPVRVIFLTAFVGMLAPDTSLGRRENLVLSKPFSTFEIAERLQAALSDWRRSDAAH